MHSTVIIGRPSSELALSNHYPIFSIFGWTLADNHLKGCYGITGGMGRARKLAMRRAPGLDDTGGRVGNDPRVPPARARTSARFDVNLSVGGLSD
ncbi:jg12169 [Pararge aegeria aegeria]|uniref:Jg12169 protein n=1 Tax=Pararge aegeria aegeria TaxID=348720 RepID=A0A8S4RMX0_9NEOP|nr:jg12169 [Pararge aegeria aegeria]